MSPRGTYAALSVVAFFATLGLSGCLPKTNAEEDPGSTTREVGGDGEGSDDPILIAGPNRYLIRPGNASITCRPAQESETQFIIECIAQVVDENGKPRLAEGAAPGVKVDWADPVPDNPNAKVQGCRLDYNDMRQTCRATLDDLKPVNLDAKLTLTKGAETSTSVDRVVLPYSIQTFGSVSQIGMSFHTEAELPNSPKSSRGEIGYIPAFLPAKSHFFQAPHSVCHLGGKTYFDSAGYIYEYSDTEDGGVVRLFAGSGNAQNVQNLLNSRTVRLTGYEGILNFPIACGKDSVLISDPGESRILRAPLAGPVTQPLVRAMGGFIPDVLTETPDGILFTDYSGKRLFRLSGNSVTWIGGALGGTNGTGGPNLASYVFGKISSILFHEGTLFVTDSVLNRVMRINLTAPARIAEYTDFNSGWPWYRPAGTSLAPSKDKLFVVDKNRVTEVPLTPAFGTPRVIFGEVTQKGEWDPTKTPTGLNTPGSITSDAAGNLYIADTGNNRLVRLLAPAASGASWSPQWLVGTDIFPSGAAWDRVEASQAKFNNIRGVAVDPVTEEIFVTQTFHHVRAIGKDKIVRRFAGSLAPSVFNDGGAALEMGLWGPEELAIAPDRTLYVANRKLSGDTKANVIRAIQEGALLNFAGCFSSSCSTYEGTAAKAFAFQEIKAMAVGPDGTLYLVDGNRVRKIVREGSTNVVRTLAGGATLMPGSTATVAQAYALGTVGGITVNSDGVVFFAELPPASGRTALPGNTGLIPNVPAIWALLPNGDLKVMMVAPMQLPTRLAYLPDGNLLGIQGWGDPMLFLSVSGHYVKGPPFFSTRAGANCGSGILERTVEGSRLESELRGDLGKLCHGKVTGLAVANRCARDGTYQIALAESFDTIYQGAQPWQEYSGIVVRVSAPCPRP